MRRADSELAPLMGSLEVDAPEVAISRRPPIVIRPPVKGDGWLVSSGCCKPNIHRDLRIAVDGVRIETPETFAIDWNRVKNDRIYDGEGNQLEQHYAFGQEVFAVADKLGQGGSIGHYPVHFHMARKTSDQNTPPTEAPYIKDSSIHDSMTRWITVHATQGMIVQRNVGYQSIGHGFYLEDATEVNNKIYGNLGASVIAAVQPSNGQPAPLNPRKVPGILARPGDAPGDDLMPYRSDWNHPSAFWIMNGWNDFQYNMAAGVTSCGACYWLLPGAVSGPSMYEVWDGYASQQVVVGRVRHRSL